MSRCTCLWRDGRRVDGTHCPVHDTLTGVPPAEPTEPDTDADVLRLALAAEMHRRMDATAGGRCYRCAGRLEHAAGWAKCQPCGVGYQASVTPDGRRRFTEMLLSELV